MNFSSKTLDGFINNGYNLNNCDKEPIHIPGFIQSFAILIIADSTTKRIVAVSENIDRIGYCKDTLLGKPLLTVVDNDSLIDNSISEIEHCSLEILGKYHSVHKKISNGFIYVEIEVDLNNNIGLEEDIDFNANTLEYFYFNCAQKLYELSDFNRVMIYKFDEDYNGEVVAEAKDEELESYLGLNYPAADIPKQAREMYKLNPLRVIYDVDGQVIPIFPLTNGAKPWNLTPAVSRGVSPIHVEYLKNMNVASSMSVSIMDERNRLVALIAFHNSEPTLMPYSLREKVLNLAKEISETLPVIEEMEYSASHLKAEEIKERILSIYEETNEVNEEILEELTVLADCDSALFIEDEKQLTFNMEIKSEYLKDFLPIVEEVIEFNEFVTRQMVLHFPESYEELSGLCGALIFKTPKGWLMLFKKETIESVDWAGRPEKDEESGFLTPRKSFELWKEVVKMRSKKWQPFRRRVVRSILNEFYGKY